MSNSALWPCAVALVRPKNRTCLTAPRFDFLCLAPALVHVLVLPLPAVAGAGASSDRTALAVPLPGRPSPRLPRSVLVSRRYATPAQCARVSRSARLGRGRRAPRPHVSCGNACSRSHSSLVRARAAASQARAPGELWAALPSALGVLPPLAFGEYPLQHRRPAAPRALALLAAKCGFGRLVSKLASRRPIASACFAQRCSTEAV
jgi:hypothetical protein